VCHKTILKILSVVLLTGRLFFAPDVSFAQCVDFDGDGRADSCGSVGNVPMPTAIERVDTGSYSSGQEEEYSVQQRPAAKKAHQPTGPSMETMVTMTVFESLLQGMFSPPPEPAGPTPEQIEAQRKLEEMKKLEFQRANKNLMNKLKGGAPVSDAGVVEAGGLKLKGLPSSGETHRDFFGAQGSQSPTVALLRDPVTGGPMDSAWLKDQQKLIEQRLDEPNKWSDGIYRSLKTKAPPLPYKKFNELQSGDVVLVNASGLSRVINKADNALSGADSSGASHTVLYLREVNGVKHFVENVPGEGPRIIFEDEFLSKYASRGAQVAKLAQPLSDKEAKKLYSAAVEMAAKNRQEINNSQFLGTNYGAWGKDNVVCSEADWALLNMARDKQVPASGDAAKRALGVDFSPADFFDNGQHFLVSPMEMPSR